MSLYKVEAVVLRSGPFGEADRLVTLLSPDRGKIRAVAKGTSKPHSRLAAAVQPFVRARFILWAGKALDGISQAEIVRVRPSLSADPGAMAAASYCCELVEGTAQERQEANAFFALLDQALEHLAAAGADGRRVALRWFELQLLAAAGFAPQLSACASCGGEVGGEGKTAYHPEAGGLLCDGCAKAIAQHQQGPGLVWLGRSAVAALRYFRGVPVGRLAGVRVGPRTMAELERALGAHWLFVLQRPIRSRAFLDIL